MGFLGSAGGILNDLTGASSASSQQQKYNKRLMAQEAGYNEHFARNAHQMEVQDLQKAGINPLYTAGGPGASADVSGQSAGIAQANMNPMDIVSGLSSAKQMLSNSKLADAQTANAIAENPYIGEKRKAEIVNLNTGSGLNSAKTGLAKEQTRSEKGSAKNITGSIRKQAEGLPIIGKFLK